MPSIELPATLHRAGAILDAQRSPKGRSDKREVSLSFSSEEPYRRWWGWEVLGHATGEVDMSRLDGGAAPLLTDHRANVDSQVGVVASARIENGRGTAVVRFGTSTRAAEMLERVRDGELTGVSVGYRITDLERVGERDGESVYRASWAPYEISLVALPADTSVGVGRDDQGAETIELEIKEAVMPNPTPTAAQPQRPDPAMAERQRVQDILAVGSRFNVAREAESAVREGVPAADFRARVLDILGERDTGDTHAGATRLAIDHSGFGGGSDQRLLRDYSLSRLVRATVNNDWREAGLEREVAQEIGRQAGRSAQGVYVPSFALAERALVDTGAGVGAGLVGTDHLANAFIASLEPEVAVLQLGARVLQGLSRDVSIPRMTAGTSAEWVAEGAGATESDPTFDTVPLTFKHLTANVRYSKRMAVQADPAVEQLMRSDLRRQVAIGLDRAAINGAGTATEPGGILSMAGVGSVALGTDGAALSWDKVVSFLEAVDAADAGGGSLGFLSNSKVKAQLMRTAKMDGVGFILEMADGRRMAPQSAPGATTHPAAFVAGHPAVFTNLVPSNLTKGSGTGLSAMIFGNWRDLMIGDFGGMDLIVDPYTESQAGNVRITVHSHWDIAARHAESFAVAKDIATT